MKSISEILLERKVVGGYELPNGVSSAEDYARLHNLDVPRMGYFGLWQEREKLRQALTEAKTTDWFSTGNGITPTLEWLVRRLEQITAEELWRTRERKVR